MGKRIISQRRGRGSARYVAPSHRYRSRLSMPPVEKGPIKGRIAELLHCSGHSGPVARIEYENDTSAYIPAPLGIREDEAVVFCGDKAEKGNILELADIPEGTEIYNIEAKPGDGGKFVRSSGEYAKVVSRFKNKVTVILPSKKTKDFSPACRACIGVVAGGGRLEKPLVKAGAAHFRMKARNKLYPKTSGTSMNALDHPYGTSRTGKKGRPTVARKNAPPGAKVGKIKARRTGRKRGKRQ